VQALEAGDERAAYAVAAFQTLYDVEDCVRDADDATRLQLYRPALRAGPRSELKEGSVLGRVRAASALRV
jgi:hypothetical protein